VRLPDIGRVAGGDGLGWVANAKGKVGYRSLLTTHPADARLDRLAEQVVHRLGF
jgi:hypothetical protein